MSYRFKMAGKYRLSISFRFLPKLKKKKQNKKKHTFPKEFSMNFGSK